ncbi:hypothetical protein [Pseudoalteromonas piscicida]|uniref:hypothetical protein n=1 Tax=Pseudoalteromonas piscicida TaxID=43662 RepID=UPI0030A64D2B
MSAASNIAIIKHSSLWIVFSYFYLSGLNMALTLSIDSQRDPDITMTLLHVFLFNCLVGHLITKYEKLWPEVASLVIALFGVIGFGHYFVGSLGEYSDELNIGLILLLPFATFVMKKLKQYADEKAAD